MIYENNLVAGFSAAIEAMRNPMDSWDKSDSYISPLETSNIEHFVLGEKDRMLSQKLCQAGNEHRKHLRQIQVWTKLNLPRYLWQEFDTYHFVNKVSCSTMHTLMKRNITPDMFEDNDVDDLTLQILNDLRCSYLISKDSDETDKANEILIEVKRKLPEGFLQMRSINTNYEVLLKMYFERYNHRLPIWRYLCKNWILELPYFNKLTGFLEEDK